MGSSRRVAVVSSTRGGCDSSLVDGSSTASSSSSPFEVVRSSVGEHGDKPFAIRSPWDPTGGVRNADGNGHQMESLPTLLGALLNPKSSASVVW